MTQQAIYHIDHVTYAGRPENEEHFLNQWKLFGFTETDRLQTVRFPATHIALTSGAAPGFPWGTMTGLNNVRKDAYDNRYQFVYHFQLCQANVE